MTDLADLLTTLHPLEAKVLRALDGTPDAAGEAHLAGLAGMQEAQARMASEWRLRRSWRRRWIAAWRRLIGGSRRC